MADKFEWREITDQEVMRKSTVIRAAIFLVLIFIGILVINDFVFYRYMNRAETHTSTEQEKGTTPDGLKGIKRETSEMREKLDKIQKQVNDVESNFKETKQLRGEMNGIKEQVQTNFSEIHSETKRIKSDLQSASEDLSEVEKQMSSTIIEHKSDLEKIRTEMAGDRKEFGKRLTQTESKMNDLSQSQHDTANKVENLDKSTQSELKGVKNRQTMIWDKFNELEKGVQKDLKGVQNRQAHISDQIKQQDNRIQTNMKTIEKIGNEQTEVVDKLRNAEKEFQTGLRAIKSIEDSQTEISNQLKKQEDELNQLRTRLDGDSRPGKTTYYRLSNLQSFFHIEKKVDQPVFTIKGIPFHVYFKSSLNLDHKSKYLAIFLFKHPTTEAVKAKFEFTLINLNGKQNMARTGFEHEFDATKGVAWGWPNFIKQQELYDLGFVKDDEILVKIYVEILDNTTPE